MKIVLFTIQTMSNGAKNRCHISNMALMDHIPNNFQIKLFNLRKQFSTALCTKQIRACKKICEGFNIHRPLRIGRGTHQSRVLFFLHGYISEENTCLRARHCCRCSLALVHSLQTEITKSHG